MDIGSIFLILALLVPVLIFIGRPLFEQNLNTRTQGRQVISTLLAERDQLVATIQELDDDFNLGKVPSENYSSQRLGLLQKGAEVLRQIDTYQSTSTRTTAEERLEAVILKRHQALDVNHVRKNGNAVPPVPDDDLEQMIATRRRTMQGKAAGFCPKCGKPVQISDLFCPRCGATLS
jgi:NADH pyrophosphatase NudC (nudix superfamily)